MATTTAQQPAKKAKKTDSFKNKEWYTVVAPDLFEGKEIGQVLAEEDKTLPNRLLRVNLGEVTGQFSQTNAYTSLFFRITEVKGKTAYTKYLGHAIDPGYIRTLVRRRRSVVGSVEDVKTRDGETVRVKMLLITAVKVSTAIRHALRAVVSEQVHLLAKETDFPQFAQEVVFGKLASKLYAATKKIAPVRRIEARKLERKEVFTQ